MKNSLFKMMKKFKKKSQGQYIVGIDLETGGLNCATNSSDPIIPKDMTGAHFYPILQIAVIVYDNDFKEVAEPLNIIIHHTKEDLDNKVGEWSKKQFKDTLMIQCPESDISLKKATKMVVKHLKEIGVNKENLGFLFGNSIRLDIEFIVAQMSELDDVLHYRLFDVSTLKTMFHFMFGDAASFDKKATHDALDDIRESRDELQFYLDNFIVSRESFAREMMEHNHDPAVQNSQQ